MITLLELVVPSLRCLLDFDDSTTRVFRVEADGVLVKKGGIHMAAPSWTAFISHATLNADEKSIIDIRSQESNVFIFSVLVIVFRTL